MRASDRLWGFFGNPPTLPADLNAAEWDAVKAEAGFHRVAPLLAFAARSSLTGAEREWCDRVLLSSWRKHSRNMDALRRVCAVFDAAGVPFISLKGPILATRHYSPAFLRSPSGDLDFAVRESDLAKSCAALVEDGFTMTSTLAVARRTSYHAILQHPALPDVELHFRLCNGGRDIPAEDLLARSREFEAPWGKVLILGEADELMHSALHLVQDRFVTLFHMQEVRRIWASATPGLRREAALRAAHYGFSGAMSLANTAATVRWGEPLVPADAELPRTWLQGRIGEALYRRMEAASELRVERTVSGRLAGRWAEFQLADSPVLAARGAWNALACAAWEAWEKRRPAQMSKAIGRS
jgi:hypothetical protein